MDRIITGVLLLVTLLYCPTWRSPAEEADVGVLRLLLSSDSRLFNLSPQQRRILDDATANAAKYLPMMEELIDQHLANGRFLCLQSVTWLLGRMDNSEARRVNLKLLSKAIELYSESRARMNAAFALIQVGFYKPVKADRDLARHAIISFLHADPILRKLILCFLEENFVDDSVIMDFLAQMVREPREGLSNNDELKALLGRRKDKPTPGGGELKK